MIPTYIHLMEIINEGLFNSQFCFQYSMLITILEMDLPILFYTFQYWSLKKGDELDVILLFFLQVRQLSILFIKEIQKSEDICLQHGAQCPHCFTV